MIIKSNFISQHYKFRGGAKIIMTTSYFFGAFACFIAAVIWGILYPITYSALAYMDALALTSLRCIITAIILAVTLLIIEGKKAFRITKKDALVLWICGSLGLPVNFFLAAYAQKLIGVEGSLNAALIMASSPLVSLLIVSIIKRNKPSLVTFLCILVSFVGITLVITKGEIAKVFDTTSNPFANFLIILSMVGFVFYTLGVMFVSKMSSLAYTTMTSLISVTTTIAMGIFFLQAGVIQIPTVESLMKVTPHLLYMTFIASIVAYLLWNYGNKIISPVNGILFLNIEPITTVIVLIFIASMPTNIQIIGMIITIIALIINNLKQRKHIAN